MKPNIHILVLLLVFAPAPASTPPSGGPYQITRSTIDGGGTASAAGPYQLRGTAGQADAGPLLSGDAFTLRGGFWNGEVAPSESLFRDSFESGAVR